MTTGHHHEHSASDERRVIDSLIRRTAGIEAAAWRKATFSNGSCACVEVAPWGDVVLVRDTKNDPADDVILALAADHFQQWADAVARGLLPVTVGTVDTTPAFDGGMVVTDTADGRTLTFTSAERVAFAAGVEAGEFLPAAL